MDDHYIYVFVRQDIPLAEQMVHVGHVAYHMGHEAAFDGIPSLVVIGCPHTAALDRVIRKLMANSIQHQIFHDPDTDYGVTAIATVPLSPQEKTVLANYRLWRNAGVAAKSDEVSHTEHSVSNGECVGENPSVGSSL